MESKPELPDLPALESVETGAPIYLLIVAATSGFTSLYVFMAMWCFLRYRAFLRPSEIALIAVIVLLFAFASLRVLSGYFRFKTDGNGISARGPIRRKFISWLEVKDAYTVKSRHGTPYLALITDRGRFGLSPRGVGISPPTSECLLASAWQHLRRLGKAGRIELTPSMLTLWQGFPDDVPAEMQWGKKPGPANKIALLLMPACMLGAIAYLSVDAWGMLFPMLLMSAMALMVAVTIRIVGPDFFRKADIVRVSRDGLDAELAFGRVFMPWSAVRAASWVQQSVISIRSSAPAREVRIPYVLGSRESEHLILAVIRYLRTAGVPQAITFPRGRGVLE